MGIPKEHNRWEIPESILGKFLCIFDRGLDTDIRALSCTESVSQCLHNLKSVLNGLWIIIDSWHSLICSSIDMLFRKCALKLLFQLSHTWKQYPLNRLQLYILQVLQQNHTNLFNFLLIIVHVVVKQLH